MKYTKENQKLADKYDKLRIRGVYEEFGESCEFDGEYEAEFDTGNGIKVVKRFNNLTELLVYIHKKKGSKDFVNIADKVTFVRKKQSNSKKRGDKNNGKKRSSSKSRTSKRTSRKH